MEGVPALRGTDHATLPDRSRPRASPPRRSPPTAMSRSPGPGRSTSSPFLHTLRRAGGEFAETPAGLEFWRERELTAADVETGVHPGLMTDWQQPLTVLLTQARGTSVVHETIYEDRFGYTEQLRAMGATTQCLGATACRFGNRDFLHTAKVTEARPAGGPRPRDTRPARRVRLHPRGPRRRRHLGHQRHPVPGTRPRGSGRQAPGNRRGH